ncbi:beta-lactamase/transpeptidase-like protein [Durotheca rogersii]|uniref:beta-lactamase/transpeptidase-like protein n=1 Tax=Durotheca rogersii TaxID=419775 RepID=UPI00221EB683|nr:beta-lactamase/transpeptidase-like protein [Durotheca rogersii]KAI5860317.1 beta-lactamase/transpeptidase-like protein [Durotheca rogersii]
MAQVKGPLGALSILAALFCNVFASKNNHCPPLGPVLPAPTSPSSHPDVQVATATLGQVINATTGTFNATAVSISVKSVHETSPLFDFHHTPPQLDPRGASLIDASTLYRIGSVTKVFTVLTALKTSGIRMEDPITKYLPRLRELKQQKNGPTDHITAVDWDDVTLHALASHMGGIGSDLVTDLASFPVDFTKLGLPPARDVLGCVGFQGIEACNETDFWDNFGKRNPVYAPYNRPLYSNTAFFLLSLVVESVSGMPFDDVIQSLIFDPAGMASTSFAKPDDKLGAISVGNLDWSTPMGIENPAGGLYSNTKDLLAFAESILTNKFLSPAQTRRWLKPVTFTSSLGTFVGAPWEIVRAENITSDERLVELYTKGGDDGAYHVMLVLVPDYDLVAVILTAGPESSSGFVQALASQVVAALVPAIDTAGQHAAAATYVGTYADAATNSTLTLALDGEGPGLAITHWSVRGTDVPAHWLNYMSALAQALPPIQVSARLYPAGLEGAGGRSAWRVGVDLGTPEDIARGNAGLVWAQGSCLAWALMDRVVYEFGPLDEIIFALERSESYGDVTAVSVELVGFQTTLRRVEV